VKKVLPTRGFGAIYGPPGSGKSFLAIDLAAAIAGGQKWFGYRTKKAPVLYLALEGEGGIRVRAKAWVKHNDEKLPSDLHFILDSFNFLNPQDVSNLIAIAPKNGVIFFDTLNRAAPTADENSSEDMGTIIEAVKRIERETESLVILIHHTGKDVAKGLRGHSSLIAALETAIEVDIKADLKTFTVRKSKESEGGVSKSFKLLQVHLYDDEDRDAVTSCVVVPADAPPELPTLTPDQQIVFDALKETDVFDVPIALDEKKWRDGSYARMTDKQPDARQKAFKRAMDALLLSGRVREMGDKFVVCDFFD
jgi:putative DNA primase/helicase